MRILVTGGAGYVGSHAVRHFRASGHEVWVFDNLSTGHRAAVPADRLIVGDLSDAPAVEGALKAHAIEAVVHFAASAYVGESVLQPEKYYRNNVVNTLYLLGCMRRCGVSRLVFSSTCATYGIPTRVPIREDDPQCPVNPYGATKLAVERALCDFAAAYEFGFAALRYFNAAGAAADGSIGEDHEPETHLIPLIIQAALGRRPHLELHGSDYPTPDGSCVRDYVHVDDLAEAHRLVLDRVAPGAKLHYNLGTGRGYSVREVVRLVEEVSGVRVRILEGRRRAGDPPVLVASADKARIELGWKPRHSDLGSILESAWRWHQARPNGYADRAPGRVVA